MDNFIAWFQSHNGLLNLSDVAFAEISGQGRALLALRDISQGHTLFSIPRELTLSTRTSRLPALIGAAAWKKLGLHTGWVGLILCMMWEEAQAATSKWSGYLDILPSHFDTPMFWDQDELRELQGTSVVDKIGKADVERDYTDKLLPALKSRPDLFPHHQYPVHYSLEKYHIMGSRVLSRSFNVEEWRTPDDDEDEKVQDTESGPNTSLENAMDVDEPPADEPAREREDAEDGGANRSLEQLLEDDGLETDDEDAEDPGDVAMVPMADMLNARYQSENAKLFHEERELKMVTTKPIKAGEQIWNTYGDPPNSHLLRRYGHVDLVPLPPPLEGEGNPEDIVEIRADLLVAAASSRAVGDPQERIDWWLEFADDDTFVIGTDCELPKEMVSLAHLLLLPGPEWEKQEKKFKLPKGKPDMTVLPIIIEVFKKRLTEYPTSLEDDEELLRDHLDDLSVNKRNAIIVRVGEKRILQGTLKRQETLLLTLNRPATKAPGADKKRKAPTTPAEGSSSKGQVRGKKAKR